MKKTVVMSIGAVLVIAALISALFFALGGGEKMMENNPILLEGSWAIVARYQNDVPTFLSHQTIIFTEDMAMMYKDDTGMPYASGLYSVNAAGQLLLPYLSREYKVTMHTRNCVRLYESATTYMLLVRNGSPVTAEMLQGRWNVAMKGDQLNNGEVLEFTERTVRYYRKGLEQPVVTAEFIFSRDGILLVEEMGLSMNCYSISEKKIALIEQSGVVWELSGQ